MHQLPVHQIHFFSRISSERIEWRKNSPTELQSTTWRLQYISFTGRKKQKTKKIEFTKLNIQVKRLAGINSVTWARNMKLLHV